LPAPTPVCYRRCGIENFIDGGAESMIVRERADGTLILVGETDHAKLSGPCAARRS
jgi:hypothetical protein